MATIQCKWNRGSEPRCFRLCQMKFPFDPNFNCDEKRARGMMFSKQRLCVERPLQVVRTTWSGVATGKTPPTVPSQRNNRKNGKQLKLATSLSFIKVSNRWPPTRKNKEIGNRYEFQRNFTIKKWHRIEGLSFSLNLNATRVRKKHTHRFRRKPIFLRS